MPILYSAIARGATIICCHQQEQLSNNIDNNKSGTSFVNENYNQTNYSLLVSNILPNISTASNANTSYTTNNEVMINVMVEEGLVFLCACNGDVNKNKAFEFLAEIKCTFTENQALMQRAPSATNNELNRDFAPFLSKKMVEHSTVTTPTDILSRAQAQVEEVKGVMTRNIDAVLDRGQKLEDLIDKSNDLEANANSFQRTTRRVQRKMWWRNTKTNLAIGIILIIVIIIVLIIILFSTGVFPIHTDTKTTTTSPPITPVPTTTETTTSLPSTTTPITTGTTTILPSTTAVESPTQIILAPTSGVEA